VREINLVNWFFKFW